MKMLYFKWKQRLTTDSPVAYILDITLLCVVNLPASTMVFALAISSLPII